MTSRLLPIAILVLGLVSLLNAHVELYRAKLRRDVAQQSAPTPLPSIGFSSFNADLLWISVLIAHGEQKRVSNRPLEWMTQAGHLIVDSDPYFYTVYEFIPAMAIAGGGAVDEALLNEIEDFVMRGAHVFPQNADLPFSAAMNYIGYSAAADDARRLREVSRAIELVELSLSREPSTERLAVLSWFQQRKATLEGKEVSRSERLVYLQRVYDTTDDLRLRDVIADEMRYLGHAPARSKLSDDYGYVYPALRAMISER